MWCAFRVALFLEARDIECGEALRAAAPTLTEHIINFRVHKRKICAWKSILYRDTENLS